MSPKSKPKSKYLSAEFVQDSSSEDDIQIESIQDTVKKAIAAEKNKGPIEKSKKLVVNGMKKQKQRRKTPEPSSESSSLGQEKSSESESDRRPSKAPPSRPQKRPEAVEVSSECENSDGEEGATSSTGSESIGGKTIPHLPAQTRNGKPISIPRSASQNPRKEPEVRTTQQRPSKPFTPPSRFKAIKEISSSRMAQLIRDGTSSGQEIWYITAPASVPMSGVREVNLGDVAKGKTVLTHQEQDYAFVEDHEGTAGTTRVLVPGDGGMELVPSKVRNVMRLQQVVRLPGISLHSVGPPTAPKARREQPKGLKMRWKPSGAADMDVGSIGGSSDGEQQPSSTATSRRPHRLEFPDSGSPKKRKHRHEEDEESRGKKHKKHRNADSQIHPSSEEAASNKTPHDELKVGNTEMVNGAGQNGQRSPEWKKNKVDKNREHQSDKGREATVGADAATGEKKKKKKRHKEDGIQVEGPPNGEPKKHKSKGDRDHDERRKEKKEKKKYKEKHKEKGAEAA